MMAAIKSGGGFWEFLRFLGVGGIAALAAALNPLRELKGGMRLQDLKLLPD